MRGTRDVSPWKTQGAGIIPACAGTTSWSSCPARTSRDHPRVCGEHLAYKTAMLKEAGSSPRVRGTHEDAVLDVIALGIIPACAGNTCSRSLCTSESSDHPRVCGEHCAAIFTALAIAGSSPRVRGTPLQKPILRHQGGIIPACAGNTPLCTVRVTGAWGSSPRVRGTPRHGGDVRKAHGIIPACAGNTRWWSCTPRQGGDHPRVCGEHFALVGRITMSPGSSPRVRGTLQDLDMWVEWGGIIPACAGNTQAPFPQRRQARDHPRVCGEHYWLRYGYAVREGSSPRVRGTR